MANTKFLKNGVSLLFKAMLMDSQPNYQLGRKYYIILYPEDRIKKQVQGIMHEGLMIKEVLLILLKQSS